MTAPRPTGLPAAAAHDGGGPHMHASPGQAWHAGELAVQDRAGVRADAERLAGMLQPDLFPAAARLLVSVPVLIVAGLDQHDRMWAGAVVGAPAAARVDVRYLWLRAPSPSDPVAGALRPGAQVGMTAVDFAARRRVRVNGTVMGPAEAGPVALGTAGQAPGWVVRTEQVYGNCPQRITPRDWMPSEPVSPAAAGPPAGAVTTWDLLDDGQQARVRTADTFFLATTSLAGADASHRGGPPGTLTVHGPRRLSWPDLPGNNMFNSAGNLAVDARAALWFPPVADQHTALLLSGSAAVCWDAGTATGREVVFDVEAVIEVPLPARLQGRAPHTEPGF